MRLRWLLFGVVCFLPLTGADGDKAWADDTIAKVQPAILRGTIVDAQTSQAVACSVAITDATGKLVTENESFKSGFRSSGVFEKSLPPGRTQIRIWRGFETRAVDKEITLQAGATNEIRFSLERVVDLRHRGWYAGDSHDHMIHGERTIPVDFDFVALTAQAEDLQYLSLSHTWSLANPTPEALEAQLRPRSTPACVLTWNLEAPKNYYQGDAGRCLGHCWNLAVRGRTPEGQDVIQLLLAASAHDYESPKPTYANFESHQLIHAQGGSVFYTHPARWWTGPWGGQGGYPFREKMRVSNMAVELPLDVLLGPTFDGLDVLTGNGEFEANSLAFQLWALLLNHGYRVAATASSDACFDRPGGGVPGTARTYTHLDTDFSLPAVARATAQGRTFTTTGPLLLVTLDQQLPGTALHANGQPHTLSIDAWASGRDSGGLSAVEILRNGLPYQKWNLPPSTFNCRTNLQIREPETAWFCVRALGSDPRRQRAISGAFFLDAKAYQPPPPVRADVRAQIIDDRTGASLTGALTEMTYDGTVPHAGKQHTLNGAEERLEVPGTIRLRADVPGYQPLTLSPFLDNPALVQLITSLEAGDLVKWETFEKIRELLTHTGLIFRMKRSQ